jgi:hypothetical protein
MLIIAAMAKSIALFMVEFPCVELPPRLPWEDAQNLPLECVFEAADSVLDLALNLLGLAI